jgi:hypothetical protein
MSCQKYTEWQPKNICNKTVCPPPCNSDQDLCLSVKDGCDFKFYRVTITNLSVFVDFYFLVDVYSNTIYIILPSTIVDIYLPYESKNLILFSDPCRGEFFSKKFKLLQPCLINTTSNSFDLNISTIGNITFTKKNNPSPIPSKIYKVKFFPYIRIFNDLSESKFINAFFNDIDCGEYGYVWLPQGSFYTNEISDTQPVLAVPPEGLHKNVCEFNAESSEVQNVGEISPDIKQKINDLQNKFNINIFNKFKNDDK